MGRLGIGEVIMFNFLVLLEEVNQRWVYPDDLARHKLEFFMVLGG